MHGSCARKSASFKPLLTGGCAHSGTASKIASHFDRMSCLLIPSVHQLTLDPERVSGILDFEQLPASVAEGLMQNQHQPAVESLEQHPVPAVVSYQHVILPPGSAQLPGY